MTGVHQRAGEGEDVAIAKAIRETWHRVNPSTAWAWDRLSMPEKEAIIDAIFSSQRAGEPTPDEVERAAKVLAEHDGWDWHEDDYSPPDPKWQPTDKNDYRNAARAALDAARQPNRDPR